MCTVHHNKATTPNRANIKPPAACASFPTATFADVLGLEDAPVPLPVAVLDVAVMDIPEFGGLLVGVYRFSAVVVQLVNLLVALPVIGPAIALSVGVK